MAHHMDTWYEYRSAWSQRPWVAIIAVVAVLMVLAGIVGTIAQSKLAIIFIPGLAAFYIHHLIARKILES